MKPHKFDPISFIAGLIATVIGLAFLIPADPTDIVALLDEFGSWFWPVLLIVVGIAVLAPLAQTRTDEQAEAEGEAV